MSESGRKVLFVFLILTVVLLVMEEIGIDGDKCGLAYLHTRMDNSGPGGDGERIPYSCL
jgi:hypothetical protein